MPWRVFNREERHEWTITEPITQTGRQATKQRIAELHERFDLPGGAGVPARHLPDRRRRTARGARRLEALMGMIDDEQPGPGIPRGRLRRR